LSAFQVSRILTEFDPRQLNNLLAILRQAADLARVAARGESRPR
jgi:hypothetical protein